MTDPAALVALSVSGLIAVGLASAAGLRGWTGWLELRRLELGGPPSSRGRGELADLKARVRRLESIANGAEL